MEHEATGMRRQTARVALFVDGDNLPSSLGDRILEAAERLGSVDLRRVYAAEAGFKDWQNAPGYRLVQVGGAKNGTDLLLCIDSVEVACREGFDSFVLASNDRDFTHLAHWLREHGLHVLGLGTVKSAISWRAACSSFEVIEVVPAAKSPVSPPAKAPAAIPAEAPVNISTKGSAKTAEGTVRQVVRQAGQAGITLTELGNQLSQKKFTCASLQATSWRSYLAKQPERYALEPKGPNARVRWVGA